MKKKICLIPLIAIVLIAALWFAGIIPKQIARIAGTSYVNTHFPEMQFKCTNVEWASVYGDYLISFEGKDENTYSCVIGPALFPVSLGQGLFAITNYYTENYCKDSNNEAVNKIQNVSIDEFAEFLNDKEMIPRLSQGAFIDKMAQYSYEGTPIPDIIAGFFYDGLQGGGFAAGSEHFGFKNDYTAEGNIANYSNRIWTKVQLEGLTLPYGIDFDDSLSEVFQKMESTINPYNAFYADENSTTDMTLYSNEKAKLVFQDLKRSQMPVEYEMPYVLIYSEAYTTQLDDGRPDTVERTIKLSFADKDGTAADTLELFEMRVAERYEIKKY